MALPHPPFKPCPCGSGRSYQACCRPAHTGERPAPTAEALMRSRYVAFALQDEPYLRRTWHPDTCPADLDLADGTRYLGLTVHGAGEDWVNFTARLGLPGGGRAKLRERSRFVRLDGAWVYLDGDVQDG